MPVIPLDEERSAYSSIAASTDSSAVTVRAATLDRYAAAGRSGFVITFVDAPRSPIPAARSRRRASAWPVMTAASSPSTCRCSATEFS